MQTQEFDTPVVDLPTPEDTTPETEQPLSQREFKIAYKRAIDERNAKIKQNKLMLQEMELEDTYWRYQANLSKYRWEKMHYALESMKIEDEYLKAIEEYRIKEENKSIETTQPEPSSKPNSL